MSSILDFRELDEKMELHPVSIKKTVMLVFSDNINFNEILNGLKECGAEVIFYGSGTVHGSGRKGRVVVAKFDPEDVCIVRKVMQKIDADVFGAVGIETFYDYLMVEDCFAKCVSEEKARSR